MKLRVGGKLKKRMGKKRQNAIFLCFVLLALYFSPPALLRTTPQGIKNEPKQGAKRNTEIPPGSPLIYWTGGIETAESLKQFGIEQIATPPNKSEEWRKAGFKVVAVSSAEIQQRAKLLTPRIADRANVASATRSPWIDANGWRFVRNSSGRFYYDLPRGRAAIALAEVIAYKGDAILKIDPSDLKEAGAMIAFGKDVAGDDYPPIADFGIIDDGSPETGEAMNLLMRRNLLYKIVRDSMPQFTLNIKFGSKEFPKAIVANPSEFARGVRQRLGDENRSLRIYGSEMVICHLTGSDSRARLHLLNYSGRDAFGLRVRLRGNYSRGEAKAFGQGRVELEEFVNDKNSTEFSLLKTGVYAVIDLFRGN